MSGARDGIYRSASSHPRVPSGTYRTGRTSMCAHRALCYSRYEIRKDVNVICDGSKIISIFSLYLFLDHGNRVL